MMTLNFNPPNKSTTSKFESHRLAAEIKCAEPLALFGLLRLKTVGLKTDAKKCFRGYATTLRFLGVQLLFVQLKVSSLLLVKFSVRAVFNNFAFVKHDNFVSKFSG